MKLKRVSDRPRRSPSGRGRLPKNYYRQKPAVTTVPAKAPAPAGSLFGRLARRLGESLTLLAVAAIIIYSLIVSPSPTVKVNNELYHPTSAYSQRLTAIMHGFWYRNKFTFSQSSLTEQLQRQYPEVVAADVHLPLISHKPSVQVTVALPSFKLLSDGRTYLIGQQGIAITDQADPAILAKLPALVDQSGYKIELGKAALDTSAVRFIETLLAELKTAKVPVKGLNLPRTAQEIDLMTKDRPYYAKFYLGGDVLVESGQFLAARQHFQKTGQSPRQYLDVRVEGKLFYR